MAASLEDSLFRLKFTAKTLRRQSVKAGKEIESEKKKIKKAIQEGNDDIARIHAQSATRKQSERLNLLKLASRVEAVASRVQTAVTMRQVSGSMGSVVKGMDRALDTMNTEQISLIMDKFEQQFEDLDASAAYYETTTQSASALDTPQEQVDLLLQQVADEAGLELRHDMAEPSVETRQKLAAPEEEVEDALNERLRALRG
ncbi:Vacuolar protein-sorting-associated protein 46 [Wickerhamiella sorbophila]|uniref:Vacuolar protein-sorting-associated protein 46 n=1 Tax=Wickerhamiella sorbophila TaxID=45607 RepID=A0A2T0FG10_9ASCO|nr:Vacuolar protein-sorting-associated protein 46 [Wickerhamiella sorbophila]PRT53932.1 Vacuolar protein-sorting-associated protein 46 [Wickerhamiella sorbophila]